MTGARNWWAAVVLVAGCSSPPPPDPGTGAREAARGFFTAVVARDWPRGYEALAAESRARVRPERFAQLGEAYRRGLGFDPVAAHVPTCEEHGAGAVAHVSISGRGNQRHRFRDAVVLRREAGGWAVVLPTNFGQTRR